MMRNGLRCLAAIGLSVAGLAAFGPGAALAGTLDQQQTDFSGAGNTAVSNLVSRAETFKPGITGSIDQVDLAVSKVSALQPLNVEIRNVSAGAPGATVLATGSIPASGDVALSFVPINFAVPAPVVAGAQYAIVAYTTDTSSWNWGHSVSIDPYTPGVAFNSASSSGPWGASGFDEAFKTYVVPGPGPGPGPSTTGPTGQRAAALKKCAHKKSKKAKKKCKKKAKKLPV
jgi:hypothetical protein